MAGRHVWAQIEDGIVTVGVTAPLGEVLWYTPDVEFWAVDRVDVGETLATVQGRSARTVAVGSPVRGALVELNPLLRRAPHALLAQPYGRGWVARISADCWERDEAAMVPARAYRKILDADLALGREFCFGGALLAPRPAEPEEPAQAAALARSTPALTTWSWSLKRYTQRDCVSASRPSSIMRTQPLTTTVSPSSVIE
jgi:glycine cleavage system H protein